MWYIYDIPNLSFIHLYTQFSPVILILTYRCGIWLHYDTILRMKQPPSVIIYDSECVMCSTWVLFVLRRDTKQQFKFTPLNGQYAQQFFAANQIVRTETIWLIDSDHHFWHSSSATLRVISRLGGIYRVVALLLLIPKFIRNSVYFFISKRRRLLMKRSVCPVMPDEYADRFVD